MSQGSAKKRSRSGEPSQQSPVPAPFIGRFACSRAELIADGVVHAVGVVLAIAAGSALLAVSAFHTAPGEYAAAVFYVVSLLSVLSISCAYNLWPVSPAKWISAVSTMPPSTF